ncbi:MAG: PBP1A family penicillin-binding protein [Pseudomonadota bacterium]
MAKATKSSVRKPGAVERGLRAVFRTIFRIVWAVGYRVALVLGLVVGLATAYYYGELPEAEALLDGRERGSVTLTDRNGNIFAWRGEQGDVLTAAQMSEHLRNAVVATEDKRFYSHLGISPRGIASAIRINLREGRSALQGHGGSTITQQVIKLVFLSSDRTLVRKLKEVPYALAMELKYSKDEILSIYMNRAYLGASTTGFEAASQRYFGKSARVVNPAEAAMLAGLLKAPSRFAPTSDLERAQDRANLVLTLMRAQGYLTAEEYESSRANPAQLSRTASQQIGGAFADWVMGQAPDYLTSATTEDVIISTTFDPQVQRLAEAALARVFEEQVREGSKAQAAIVVMDKDGAVRAVVGGRGRGGVGQFNRATQALRQPGSAFKPFVYAAGLEAGIMPSEIIADRPLTIDVPGSGAWSPKNYTRDFKGPMTVAEAFARSTNTVAVRVAEAAGRNRVRAVARDLGIGTPLAPGPSVALGVSEVSLMELTGAYAAFLNTGQRAKPYGLLEMRLRRAQTPILTNRAQPRYQIVSPQVAGRMTYLMNQVVEAPWGTGRRAAIPGRMAAGKTGTTQAARDAWFVGFTADYVAGVWMGYDDNTPLTGVTGGGLPAEIWRQLMVDLHADLPPRPLPMILPERPIAQIQPQRPAPQPQRQAPTIGSLLESVLGGIFGN